MARRTSGARPNFLIVLLDAARWQDFPGVGHDRGVEMPFVQEIERESLVFPRAVAPAPWTIPSHASLFTGLYPWECGVHRRAALDLPPDVPTLAELLGAVGYRTLSASSNGFVSPTFHLTRGFSAVAWGDWWEKFLQLEGQTRPPHSLGAGPALRQPTGKAWKAAGQSAHGLFRFPITINLLNEFVARFRGRPSFEPRSGPWVEATVRRWLLDQPAEDPVFCFLNLHDAHEPYYAVRGPDESFSSFRARASVRMDQSGFVSGRWRPTPEELRVLHDLYRETYRTLDRRIRTVVQAFRDAGRWDDTVLLVTSDHGQEFVEPDFLFHSLRVSESLLRIPMVLRIPPGRGRRGTAQGWASLIDVAPTFLGLAGESHATFPSAVPLESLVDAPRPGPVLALGDGFDERSGIARACPPERRTFWNRIFAVGYEGSTKLRSEVDRGRSEAFDVDRDPAESHDLFSSDSGWNPTLRAAVDDLSSRLRAPSRGPGAEEVVDDRLSSWGY